MDKNTGPQINLSSKIESCFDDSNDTFDGRRTGPSPKANITDSAVKEMLDSSDIIDDSICSPSHIGSFDGRFFQRKFSELQQDSKKSFEPIQQLPHPQSRRLVQFESYAAGSDIAGLQLKQLNNSSTGESYRANVFVNQVPLVNGMDGRDINDLNELYQAVKKYKTVTTLIEKHINQDEHVFHQMIDQFEQYFIKQYGEAANVYKLGNMSFASLEEMTTKATIDLQQFIVIMYEAISQFYCLENLNLGKQSGHEILFNKNNMINFITSMIFRSNIHDVIFGLYGVKTSRTEERYRENCRLCAMLKPQDFGVTDSYCLNEKTAELLIQQGKVLKKRAFLEEIKSEYSEENKPSMTPNQFHVPVTEEDVAKEDVNETKAEDDLIKRLYEDSEDYIPYERAISYLKVLKTKNSPIHKLKTIVRVAEIVNENIEEFYARYDAVNQEKMSGDQTLAIFVYIIARSELDDIITHCKIIEKFSTNNILSSVSGYYAVTLEACVNYLASLSLAKDFSVEKLSAGIKELYETSDIDQCR